MAFAFQGAAQTAGAKNPYLDALKKQGTPGTASTGSMGAPRLGGGPTRQGGPTQSGADPMSMPNPWGGPTAGQVPMPQTAAQPTRQGPTRQGGPTYGTALPATTGTRSSTALGALQAAGMPGGPTRGGGPTQSGADPTSMPNPWGGPTQSGADPTVTATGDPRPDVPPSMTALGSVTGGQTQGAGTPTANTPSQNSYTANITGPRPTFQNYAVGAQPGTAAYQAAYDLYQQELLTWQAMETQAQNALAASELQDQANEGQQALVHLGWTNNGNGTWTNTEGIRISEADALKEGARNTSQEAIATTQAGATTGAAQIQADTAMALGRLGWTNNGDGTWTNTEGTRVSSAAADLEAARNLSNQAIATTAAGAQTGVADINAKAQIDALIKAGEIEKARALASNSEGGTDYLNRAQQALLAGNANTSAETIATTQAGAQTGVANINAAGGLAQVNAQNTGALSVANANNLAALEQLTQTIAGQRGIATEAQQAESARLQAQIQGTSALASQQAQLTNETEQQRYLRALQQQSSANTRMDDVMNRFGFTGTPTGGNASPQTMGPTQAGAIGAPGASGATGYDSGATDAAEISAEDAAFARAKDKIGQMSRAGADTLSQEMSSRGITGSGVEAQRLGGVVESGIGEMGQVARDQAMESLKRRYSVNDRNVALASTKRAQDIGLVQSLAALAKPSGGGAY